MAAHRKSELVVGSGWGGRRGRATKAGCPSLSLPFVTFCKGSPTFTAHTASCNPRSRAQCCPRCDPCSSEVNNARAHTVHALPLPQCGLGRHAAQACGGKRQEAQAAGAPRRLARLGPPSRIRPLASPGRRCPQLDRFIPARSAIDLDVAHYNLLKENCGSGAVASPCKARCGPAHSPIRSPSCSRGHRASWPCAGRVQQAAGRGAGHGAAQCTHPGLQKQGGRTVCHRRQPMAGQQPPG